MIKNCLKESIQECSIDLRLGRLFRLKKTKLVSKENIPKIEELKLPYVLKPNEFVIGSTIEEMNAKNYSGLVIPRAYAIRIGLSIESGLLYPGFNSNVMFGIKNISENNIMISKEEGLIQVSFFEIKSDFKKLDHKFKDGVFSK